MTRRAWVTVRLPGAKTTTPTGTKIWCQTGSTVGRLPAQDTRIVSMVGWVVAEFDAILCHRIRRIESPPSRKNPHARDDVTATAMASKNPKGPPTAAAALMKLSAATAKC